MTEPLFRLRDLTISFPRRTDPVIQNLNLEMMPGESLALVGPSGCGKSLTARALCGLLPPEASWSGEISWSGQPLTDPDSSSWQAMRGKGAAMVLQEPATCLNPVLKVGDQVAETLRWHGVPNLSEARRQATALLAEVQLPEPEKRYHWYPHQLSGGMRQRVLLAAALACDPRLLIADEPTTALDLTVQLEILKLIQRVRRSRDMALLFISHDRDVVRLMCDQMISLDGGRGSEPVPVTGEEVLVTSTFDSRAEPDAKPVLAARGLKVRYPDGDPQHLALGSREAGVDLAVLAGEVVGVAGESGAGKSTLARVLTGHVAPLEGEVLLDGRELHQAKGAKLRRLRRRVQMIFQDPGASLNPRQKIGSALVEAGARNESQARALLVEVGLAPELMSRFPHQLSGGQRQRVAVARCLAADPQVIVADEITSALDNEAVALLLELLGKILARHQIALVLISHDLALLQETCHCIHVMYGGHIVEQYPTGGGDGGRHPYTRHLMSSVPARIEGSLAASEATTEAWDFSGPKLGDGCPWQPHCELAKPHCSVQLPELHQLGSDHVLRCPESR